MGHGKETPRQKMIGLMYLFLTAMLALNVSKEVLNSFVLVGNSLEMTINNYKSKNDKVYGEFETENLNNPTKVGPWKQKAEKVRSKSEEIYKILEEHKVGLAKYAEGEDTEAVKEGIFYINDLSQKDNIDKGGEYFGVMGKKHGSTIKKEIEELRELLLQTVGDKDPNLSNNIKIALDTEPKPVEEGKGHGDAIPTWESQTFEYIPLIADFVMLSKLQTDVKNMETDVINYLFSQISAGDFKVNAMEATVIPNSNYIMKGGEFRAEVFLAAYDSTKAPVIMVGEYNELEDGNYEMVGEYETLTVESGKGIFTRPSRSIGQQKWGGLIKVTTPNGGEKMYPFKEEYQVAEPNLVVSPTKMNVFYYGIDNPVDISVPGIPGDKIKPSIPGGGATIKKVKNGYIVKPTKTSGKVNVKVTAEIDGETKSMGSMPFRIKTIPEPKAKVLGKSAGTISKAALVNAPGVVAQLEDFVFDLKFRVTKFTVTVTKGGYTSELISKGNKFTKQQKNALNGIKTGSKITIESIEAVGPDGRTKPLSPIIFKVK